MNSNDEAINREEKGEFQEYWLQCILKKNYKKLSLRNSNLRSLKLINVLISFCLIEGILMRDLENLEDTIKDFRAGKCVLIYDWSFREEIPIVELINMLKFTRCIS